MKAFFSTQLRADAQGHTGRLAARDTLVVIGGVLCAYASALIWNLSEQLNAWLASYEQVQLDELPLTLLVFALLSLWFSHRRMYEIRIEIERRRRAEAELRSSQQLYKTLFDGDLTGNVVLALDGSIGMHNRAFERICRPVNTQADQLFPFHWADFVSQLQETQEINQSKIQIRRPDGLPCFVSARFIYLAGNAVTAPQIHAYLVDMTEQCLVELDLERTLRENRILARHAMQVQEQERKYIASEIHDETGQYLTAIRMDALALQKCTPDQMHVIAVRIASNTSHVQQSVRALIKHLRPPALDALGLNGACQRLVTDWRKLHPAIACHLHIALEECPLAENINIVSYRVIQEALTNISRHADATEVQIVLQQQTEAAQSTLLLEVRDNGRGMPSTQTAEGVGLIGMRERIESIQGKFTLQSVPHMGTTVRCQIPLQPVQASDSFHVHSGEIPHVTPH